MADDDIKTRIAAAQAAYNAAQIRRDTKGAIEAHHSLTQLREHQANLDAQARVAAVSTMGKPGVSRRMKALQDADANLSPFERAEFRARHEAESEALGNRVGELEKPGTAPTVDPMALQRAQARAVLNTLQNPLQRSAFLEKYGELVWGGDEPEPPDGAA